MFIVEGKDKLSKVGKVKIIKIRLVYWYMVGGNDGVWYFNYKIVLFQGKVKLMDASGRPLYLNVK